MALLAGAIVLLQPVSVNGSADRGYRHARLQRSQAARCPVRLASAGSGQLRSIAFPAISPFTRL
jgi:hypothetical protein